MGTISTGVGLASSLPIGDIVDALINAQQGPIVRLTQRAQQYATTDAGLQSLSANLLSLTTTLSSLGDESTYTKLVTNVSDRSILDVAPSPATPLGTYEFEAIRKAATQQLLSKGFANTDEQTIGEGTISIAGGGGLAVATSIDLLNGGEGIARGVFRITDGSGASAEIDVTDTATVTDILDLINDNNAISVDARVEGDAIVLEDTSGQSVSTFTVEEVGGGRAAADLGILKSTSGDTITGDDILTVSGDFTLDLINDGNGLRLIDGAPELRISLSDNPTTELDIDLSEAFTLQDVVDAINDHEDNGGKVLAEINNGQFTLTDQTGGGGPGTFQVTELNDANILSQLGLDVAAVGNTITGERVVAGLNTVLLDNLNGGQGIDTLGSLSLTDRSGKSATVDLSTATSLNDVINAINNAQDGGADLNLVATLDELGTGITITDTTAAPTSNLVIADIGGGTLAAQLNIAADTTTATVDSGSLNLQYVAAGTSIEGYAPGGGTPQLSNFSITDSAGNTASISLTTTVKTIGDVIQRINAEDGVNVHAQLNATGDGFEIVDLAGGTEELRIEDLGGGKAAEGLRLLGEVVTDNEGNQKVVSRKATQIEVTDEDTLENIVEKINESQAGVTAAIIDDGSTLNSKRIVINADTSGLDGARIISTEGIDLGLQTVVEAADAVLRIGADLATSFVMTSSTNRFNTGINALIDINQPSEDPVTVSISRDQKSIGSAIEAFISAYNTIIDSAAELTKFDPETGERGALQGEGIVLRILSRLDNEAVGSASSDGSISSLADLGITVTTGGRLQLDQDVLQEIFDENPDAVREFFAADETGFADRFEEVIDGFTDPFTGALTSQSEGLQESISSLEDRIIDLNAILDVRRQRLIQEFARMETIISQLNSQSTAISDLAALAASASQGS